MLSVKLVVHHLTSNFKWLMSRSSAVLKIYYGYNYIVFGFFSISLMDAVQAAMTTRILEPDQCRNRAEWRLVSGRRRQLLINRTDR